MHGPSWHQYQLLKAGKFPYNQSRLALGMRYVMHTSSRISSNLSSVLVLLALDWTFDRFDAARHYGGFASGASWAVELEQIAV